MGAREVANEAIAASSDAEFRTRASRCPACGILKLSDAERAGHCGSDAVMIARQIMSDFLGVPIAQCSEWSTGAQLIREGIRRYAATTAGASS
jgi:hypothetical protein